MNISSTKSDSILKWVIESVGGNIVSSPVVPIKLFLVSGNYNPEIQSSMGYILGIQDQMFYCTVSLDNHSNSRYPRKKLWQVFTVSDSNMHSYIE